MFSSPVSLITTRSLTTPRFGVTEVEEGLRAWHKLRQADRFLGFFAGSRDGDPGHHFFSNHANDTTSE